MSGRIVVAGSEEPRGVEVCESPVFIIGAPRSGTTILARALARHSELWTSTESQILWDLFGDGQWEKNFERGGADGSWLRRQGIDRSRFLAFLGLGLNAMLTAESGGRRWIDHTPKYTLLVDELAHMFPAAVFLHILRDGRHVVHSMIHYLTGGADPKRQDGDQGPPWATDFRTACRTWRTYVERSFAFQKVHPERCRTVVNERMCEDPVREFRGLCGFLQVPFEEEVPRYFRTHRINSSFPPAGGGSPRPPRPWDDWPSEWKEVFVEETAGLRAGTTQGDGLPFLAEGESDRSAADQQSASR